MEKQQIETIKGLLFSDIYTDVHMGGGYSLGHNYAGALFQVLMVLGLDNQTILEIVKNAENKALLDRHEKHLKEIGMERKHKPK